MNKKTKTILIAIIGLLFLAALVWFLLLRDVSKPPASSPTNGPESGEHLDLADDKVEVLISTDGSVNLSYLNAVPIGENTYSAQVTEGQLPALAQDESILSVTIVPPAFPSTGGDEEAGDQ